jgi:hypothetical protein
MFSRMIRFIAMVGFAFDGVNFENGNTTFEEDPNPNLLSRKIDSDGRWEHHDAPVL